MSSNSVNKTDPGTSNTQSQYNDSVSQSTQSSWASDDIPQLTVDVYRKGDSIFVVSTVAGVSPENLEVNIEGNVLMIKGVRKKPYEEKDSMILLEECFWGEFVRQLTINENLNIDKVSASLNQGILIIELPIIKITHQRKIQVSGK